MMIQIWFCSHRHLLRFPHTLLSGSDPEVQARREKERQAMKEYYEKHGGGDHHYVDIIHIT